MQDRSERSNSQTFFCGYKHTVCRRATSFILHNYSIYQPQPIPSLKIGYLHVRSPWCHSQYICCAGIIPDRSCFPGSTGSP